MDNTLIEQATEITTWGDLATLSPAQEMLINNTVAKLDELLGQNLSLGLGVCVKLAAQVQTDAPWWKPAAEKVLFFIQQPMDPVSKQLFIGGLLTRRSSPPLNYCQQAGLEYLAQHIPELANHGLGATSMPSLLVQCLTEPGSDHREQSSALLLDLAAEAQAANKFRAWRFWNRVMDASLEMRNENEQALVTFASHALPTIYGGYIEKAVETAIRISMNSPVGSEANTRSKCCLLECVENRSLSRRGTMNLCLNILHLGPPPPGMNYDHVKDLLRQSMVGQNEAYQKPVKASLDGENEGILLDPRHPFRQHLRRVAYNETVSMLGELKNRHQRRLVSPRPAPGSSSPEPSF